MNKATIKTFYRRHPIICHIAFIIVAGLLLLWGALIFLDHWTMHGSTAVVPEIKQRSYADASRILQANGLGIEISDSIYDRSYAPGTVVESWPKAGAVVKAGRQVFVTVTAFSPKQITIAMPLAGNVSIRQAMSYLHAVGITDIRVTHVPSEYPDLVIGAYYGNTPLNVGTVIPVTACVTLNVGCAPVATDPDSLDTEYSDPEADAIAAEVASSFN